jgi:hypothetical protein
MRIVLGKPVRMPRTECNGDPAVECSYGLHCGSTSYLKHYATSADAVLVCLVSPANIVAVPNYDKSKFRTTEYFPVAITSYIDGKLDVIEQKYWEDDYCTYEMEELELQIAQVKAGELPIGTASNCEDEIRPLTELQKILETRIIDLQ